MNALAGWRVVVTRAADQAAGLVEQLRGAGAVPIVLSTIAIEAPADGGVALAAASSRLATYDWIVFTSQNTVSRFPTPIPSGVKVAAIGPATAAALSSAGVEVDLVPARHVAEGLLAEFPRLAVGEGGRVLLPQASMARPVLATGLRELGYEVDAVEAYRTTAAIPQAIDLEEVAGADAVTFTSSSTVTSFLEVAGRERVPAVVACIGPVTAAAAAAAGLPVHVVAAEASAEGLVNALAEFAAALAEPDIGPGTVAE